jgi:hypothetical protein
MADFTTIDNMSEGVMQHFPFSNVECIISHPVPSKNIGMETARTWTAETSPFFISLVANLKPFTFGCMIMLLFPEVPSG